jgi:hypothetical protein
VKYIIFAVSLLSLVGCGKDINNKDAVKAAIVKRVAKTGFDVNAMDVNVTNVSFHDQDAVATVAFVPKGSAAQNAVTFKYNLHRQKDEWVATGLAQGGTNMPAHGGGAVEGMDGTEGAPHGTPAPPGPMDSSKPLPAGHPPIGSSK